MPISGHTNTRLFVKQLFKNAVPAVRTLFHSLAVLLYACFVALLCEIIRPPANDVLANIMMVCATHIAGGSKRCASLLLLQLSGLTSGNCFANAGLFRLFIMSVCAVMSVGSCYFHRQTSEK